MTERVNHRISDSITSISGRLASDSRRMAARAIARTADSSIVPTVILTATISILAVGIRALMAVIYFS